MAEAGDDWAKWAAVKPPNTQINFWGEEYAELYDWYPWMRRFYSQIEIDHDCEPAWLWLRRNSPWLPLIVCAVYMAFCYFGRKIMANRKPFDLKYPLVAWNFLLCAFSFMGAARTVPHLIHILYHYGFKYTICYKATVWYGSGAIGLWTQAFIFSKIPELGDTIFIVLRKKPLIFLHWYHHVTVLLYCWHSYYEQTTYGLYFICMNYSVHAFMYLYYALAALRIRLCKPYYITTMQISQMFVGLGICMAGGYHISKGDAKYISVENFQAGVVMYLSYMVLFLQYAFGRFLRRFMSSKDDAGKKTAAGAGTGAAGAAAARCARRRKAAPAAAARGQIKVE